MSLLFWFHLFNDVNVNAAMLYTTPLKLEDSKTENCTYMRFCKLYRTNLCTQSGKKNLTGDCKVNILWTTGNAIIKIHSVKCQV